MKPYRFIAWLLALPLLATATEPPAPISPASADVWSNGTIEGMKALPIAALQMVKAGGKTFFVSGNGRFVLTGTLLDVWNGVVVADLNDVDRIANRIDLDHLKIKIDELGPVTVGRGAARVVVFVDPYCPYCGQVQKQMEALQTRYTFKLIPVPVLGQPSQQRVSQLECLLQTQARDKVRDALLHQTYETLPAADATCDRAPMQRALVTAHLFGIEAVPFLIAPDGRTYKGAPENLGEWLDAPNKSVGPAPSRAGAGR